MHFPRFRIRSQLQLCSASPRSGNCRQHLVDRAQIQVGHARALAALDLELAAQEKARADQRDPAASIHWQRLRTLSCLLVLATRTLPAHCVYGLGNTR